MKRKMRRRRRGRHLVRVAMPPSAGNPVVKAASRNRLRMEVSLRATWRRREEEQEEVEGEEHLRATWLLFLSLLPLRPTSPRPGSAWNSRPSARAARYLGRRWRRRKRRGRRRGRRKGRSILNLYT